MVEQTLFPCFCSRKFREFNIEVVFFLFIWSFQLNYAVSPKVIFFSLFWVCIKILLLDFFFLFFPRKLFRLIFRVFSSFTLSLALLFVAVLGLFLIGFEHRPFHSGFQLWNYWFCYLCTVNLLWPLGFHLAGLTFDFKGLVFVKRLLFFCRVLFFFLLFFFS
jgi:hypothetical protein